LKLDAVMRLSPVEKVVAVEDVVVDTSMETVVDMGEAVVEDVRVGYTKVKALVEVAVDTAVEVVYKEMVDMEMKDVSGYNGGGDGYSFLLKTFYLWSQDAYLGLLNFIDNFTTTFAKREGGGYRGGDRGGGGGGYRNGDCGCYGEIGGGYESGRREGKDNGS